MFNVGGMEALVIAVLALIVLGPQRLPDAARQVGKAIGELRRLSSGFQQEVRSAFDENDRQTSAPRRDVLGTGGSAADAEAADGEAVIGTSDPSAGNATSATVPSRTAKAPSNGARRRRAPLRAEDAAPADDAT